MHATADAPREFNIPAGDLVSAIETVQKQGTVEMVFGVEQFKGYRTAGVHGTYDPADAIGMLINGTPFTLSKNSAGAITVVSSKTYGATVHDSDQDVVSQNENTSSGGLRVARADQGGPVGITAPNRKNELGLENVSNRMQEVVVTAEKREEKLQDVPASVSALTGTTLEAMGAESFTDYARTVPGLTFQDFGAGRQNPTLRGVNPSAGAVAVGYYIGDTPMPTAAIVTGASFGVNPMLVDIDRVEVLRGPQGTLYGSSSIGGTIKLIPNAPNLTRVEGSITGEGLLTQGADGASPGGQAVLVLNLPIAESLAAVRGAFWYRNSGGFISRTWSNAGTGGITDGPPAGKVGNLPDEHTWGFRTTALFEPSDKLSVTAMAYLERQHFDGLTDITGGASNPNDRLVQSFISDTPEPQDNQFALYNLTAKYSFNRFKLLSSTSYSDTAWDVDQEGTSSIQIIPEFFGLPPSSLVLPNVAHVHGSNYRLTEEARLETTESTAGFDGVMGVYYTKYHTPTGFPWVVPNNPFGLDNLYTVHSEGDGREVSEFGELTYHLTDRLSLTGGLRHYDVKGDASSAVSGLFGSGSDAVVEIPTVPQKSTGFVYKGNLSYKLTPDHLLYALYSEGLRPGGRSAPLAEATAALCGVAADAFVNIKPDSIKNYELGAKTAWLNQRLIINAAAYRINWTDIQQGYTLPQCGTQVTTNFGSAVIKGGEIEVRAQFTDLISGGLSAGYVRTEIQQDEPLLGVIKGDPILAVPKWQYAPYVETTFPLPNARVGFARLDYQYTGSSPFTYARLTNLSFDPAYEVQVVRLWNFRAGVRRQGWEVALSGTNLLNNRARQSADPWGQVLFPIPGRIRYVLTRPRTFTMSATYSF
jgi:outer membrane receptor protein involved in Fe transport